VTTVSQKLSLPFRHNLIWLAFASFCGYLILVLWMPLFPWANQFPIADIRTFTPSPITAVLYALWLCGMFLIYWLAFRAVRWGKRPFSLTTILFSTSLFALLLWQTFPINATDIYRYVIRGRIHSVYQQNSFAIPPSQFPDDDFADFAGEWADATSPYGPVSELSGSAITQLSGDNLLAGLLLFKGFAALTFLINTLLIWLLLAHQKTAVRSGYTLLWAWNPALLLIFIADGHNDGLMILWLLLGLLVTRKGYVTAGFLIMLLAPLTKPIGVLALPFFFLAALRAMPDWKSRGKFFLSAAVGAVLMIALTFLPFGSPLDLANRLLREIAAVPGFSIAVFLLFLAERLGQTTTMAFLSKIGALLMVTAILVGIWLLWRTWQGRSPVRSTADIFGTYLLQALSFRIWYASWLFPWLLLDDVEGDNGRFSYRLRVGFWFLLTSQLSVLIYGHLRIYTFNGSPTAAHLIGVPFTFGLPFLLALRDLSPKSS
jgi:alpha-1,6-mannosyltransferase